MRNKGTHIVALVLQNHLFLSKSGKLPEKDGFERSYLSFGGHYHLSRCNSVRRSSNLCLILVFCDHIPFITHSMFL